MAWDIEFTQEFEQWWDGLTEAEQASVTRGVERLKQAGLALSHPYSSQVKGSKHGRMRELRVQHQGRPFRIFYAFNPKQNAILLIGGDKGSLGNDRFYAVFVPLADAIYDGHLAELEREEAQQRQDE